MNLSVKSLLIVTFVISLAIQAGEKEFWDLVSKSNKLQAQKLSDAAYSQLYLLDKEIADECSVGDSLPCERYLRARPERFIKDEVHVHFLATNYWLKKQKKPDQKVVADFELDRILDHLADGGASIGELNSWKKEIEEWLKANTKHPREEEGQKFLATLNVLIEREKETAKIQKPSP